jgi:hypothetical protein
MGKLKWLTGDYITIKETDPRKAQKLLGCVGQYHLQPP